jgi:hypothetical protein
VLALIPQAIPPTPRIVALSPDDGSTIDLRNPATAALLSWLVPGLGQVYQGRRLKGFLFMAALLTTFTLGAWLGGGRVVYASWKPGEKRWAFVCQAGIGIAAIPALVQSWRLDGAAREPLFASGFMAPPLSRGQPVSRAYAEQLSIWHKQLGRFFEIGTLYTMLAGMLNLLVIYDAWSGPMRPAEGAQGSTRS